MPNYTIRVNSSFVNKLELIASIEDATVEYIIEEMLEKELDSIIVDKIIELYKAGKIGAREAWKATGLTYLDFQKRVK